MMSLLHSHLHMYSHNTHTHTQLPFSEFFLTHRGYMQDKPFSFPRSEMGTFGILLADRVCGPFRLEIQHIKAVRNLLTSSESI